MVSCLVCNITDMGYVMPFFIIMSDLCVNLAVGIWDL